MLHYTETIEMVVHHPFNDLYVSSDLVIGKFSPLVSPQLQPVISLKATKSF